MKEIKELKSAIFNSGDRPRLPPRQEIFAPCTVVGAAMADSQPSRGVPYRVADVPGIFCRDGGSRRIRALIRRERRQVSNEVYKVADLVLDTGSLRATRGGRDLILSSFDHPLHPWCCAAIPKG